MWNKLLNRMVDSAVPPFLTSEDQERVAAEAAENGIRQTLRRAFIAGVVLLVLIAALLYLYLPGLSTRPTPSGAVKATSQEPSQLGAENQKLRQENENLQKEIAGLHQTNGDSQKEIASLRQTNQDSQQKLDAVTKAQQAVQGKVTDLEGQVAELTTKLQAAEKSAATAKAALPPSGQTIALQGKVTDLEKQVAELTTKLQAAEKSAAVAKAAVPPSGQAAATARPRVAARAPTLYACGDGRSVRNPAACKVEGRTRVEASTPPPPSTYLCGDGRTVQDPSTCDRS